MEMASHSKNITVNNPIINEGFISSNQYSGKSTSSAVPVNIINEHQSPYKKNAIDGDREYDLCLVLKNKSVEEKCVFNIIIKQLSDAGLILYVYPSALQYDEHKKRTVQQVQGTFQRDTMTFDSDAHFNEDTLIFILIRATVKKLKAFADENDFKMLLDAKILKEIAEKGIAEKGIQTSGIENQKIKPFPIPYPKNVAHDVIMRTAIPEDRTCNPFYCKSITAGLGQDEIDIIPYEKMYGKFELDVDADYPGLYIEPSLKYYDRPTMTLSKEEQLQGKDPFGEQQRLKLTTMMFQKVIKSILREAVKGNKTIVDAIKQKKSGFIEANDVIDRAIDEVEKTLPNSTTEKREKRDARRLLIIQSIKDQLNKVYALHHRRKIEMLAHSWLEKWSVMPWNQPFHDIRNYFGEKIGIYFVFVGHYCLWLLIPVVIGVPFQIGVWISQLEDDEKHKNGPKALSNPFTPVFSYFIALWAVCMLEFWKRKEKTVAIEWGTVGCEEEEPDRPTFRGRHMKSFIDGHEGYQYYPSKRRHCSITIAYSVIAFCLLCVLAVVAGIYYAQYVFRQSSSCKNPDADDVSPDDEIVAKCFKTAQNIASILNAVQIQVSNAVFPTLAWYLTENENNRTDTQFQDSVTMKVFVFQFVNSFASFFYIAFAAASFGGCTAANDTTHDCMLPLSTNVGTIYMTRIFSSIAFDIVMPYLSHAKKSQRSAEETAMLSGPEFEYEMLPYDTVRQSMQDYAAMALHFGYIALFISALPIAGLLGFVSAIIEIKNSAWKLLSVYRRPIPTAAEDIGAWQSIFMIIAMAAVVTNAGITCFTMTVIPLGQNQLKLWIFIGFQWTCFLLQAFIMELIPDIPEAAIYHMQRNEFLVSKVIDQVRDDDDVYDDDGIIDDIDNMKRRSGNFSVEIQDNPSTFYKRESLYQPKKHPFVSLFEFGDKKNT